MIKSDRLLIVGTANLESQIYEIIWLDDNAAGDNSRDQEAPPAKISALVCADAFERDHDQGNVKKCI